MKVQRVMVFLEIKCYCPPAFLSVSMEVSLAPGFPGLQLHAASLGWRSWDMGVSGDWDNSH